MIPWHALTTAVAMAGFAATAAADGPAFDRPGISFSASTLAPHAIAWEQGTPDAQRDRSEGVTQTTYAANTRLRFGLASGLELQVSAPVFERIDSTSAAGDSSVEGSGDLSLGLKFSSPTGIDRLTWAALASISLPTAKAALGNGTEQYSLGATAAWAVNDHQSAAFYANVDVLDGRGTWTLSANTSLALSDTVGTYVEAGYRFGGAPGTPDNAVAGGGLTWMVTKTVQLDLYGDFGLTPSSTDLAAGCGVSMYFP